jgi:hypothetical protein
MTARHLEHNEIVHWSINDGRTCVGTVDLADDGAYVARDLAGQVVGTFDSLLLAARVFELVEGEG